MNKRKIVTISIATIVIGALIAWCVVLVIEANQPALYSSGSTGGLSFGETPTEAAGVVSYYYNEVTDPSAQDQSKTWLFHVLIVFAKDSTAEMRGHGHGTITTPPGDIPRKHGGQARWRFRFDDGIEKMNSVKMVASIDDRTIQIDKQNFNLQNGNLFCVFVDKDMELGRVEQLDQTVSNSKATITDFKRLLPDEPDVQAIQVE